MPGANVATVRALLSIVRKPVWHDLGKRALSAILLAPLALFGIWLGGPVWLVFVLAAAAILAGEWFILAGFNAKSLALGIPYVALGPIALVWLRLDTRAGLLNVAFLVIVVWASDIGAYLFGRLVGGPRLAPRISPGKTWSGAGGGFAAAILVGLVAALTPRAAGVAALLGIAAQSGDLLESWIKRCFGVKDSGTWIPGHGGLLDRLDGLLVAAPVAALIALLLGRGSFLWT